MKQSLKTRIYNYLKNHPEWIHGEEITKLSQQAGYEGETGRRRLRDLLEEGSVETESRRGPKSTSNWYRYKKREVTKTIYKLEDDRVLAEQVTLFQ